MSKKFKELNPKDFARLPVISDNYFCIGEERIYIHLYNQKNMHWYLAEYGSIGKKFFGFYENKSDGLTSGFCTVDEILSCGEKGEAWEPLVDESWKPVAAKEIEKLQNHINMMKSPPDS
jgi:hypothetical protein